MAQSLQLSWGKKVYCYPQSFGDSCPWLILLFYFGPGWSEHIIVIYSRLRWNDLIILETIERNQEVWKYHGDSNSRAGNSSTWLYYKGTHFDFIPELGSGPLTHGFWEIPFQIMASPSKPMLMAHTLTTVYALESLSYRNAGNIWEVRTSHHSPSSKQWSSITDAVDRTRITFFMVMYFHF